MKARKIKSFNKLDAAQMQLWKSRYSDGVEREQTSKIPMGDNYVLVVPLETEDEYILVKIDTAQLKKEQQATSFRSNDDDDDDFEMNDSGEDDDDDVNFVKSSKMYDSEDDNDNSLIVE